MTHFSQATVILIVMLTRFCISDYGGILNNDYARASTMQNADIEERTETSTNENR